MCPILAAPSQLFRKIRAHFCPSENTLIGARLQRGSAGLAHLVSISKFASSSELGRGLPGWCPPYRESSFPDLFPFQWQEFRREYLLRNQGLTISRSRTVCRARTWLPTFGLRHYLPRFVRVGENSQD